MAMCTLEMPSSDVLQRPAVFKTKQDPPEVHFMIRIICSTGVSKFPIPGEGKY